MQLLVERYHLKAHTVPLELDGFALVLEKPGDAKKLLPWKDVPLAEASLPFADKTGVDITPTGVVFRMDRRPLSQLAGFMGFVTQSTVEDRTGLDGTYTFTVRDRLPLHPTPEESEDNRLPSERYDLHPFGLKFGARKSSLHCVGHRSPRKADAKLKRALNRGRAISKLADRHSCPTDGPADRAGRVLRT